MRTDNIVRTTIEDCQNLKTIDETIIKRKNIRKMFVDNEGQHCILMAENELYYCNWDDNNIY